jgi:hypothetical protein
LQKAIEIENKMVQVITLSPIPKNLDASKKSEYEDGLKQLAEEFVKQSAAYAQALSQVEAQIDIRNKEKEDVVNLKVPKDKNDWNIIDPIPENFAIEKYLSEKKFYTAFFYLDYLNSQGKLDSNTYFFWRSFILFSSASIRNKPNQMISYILNEFNANKLESMIASWKSGSKK